MPNPRKGAEPTFNTEERKAAYNLLLYTKQEIAKNKNENLRGKPTLICAALKRSTYTQALYDVEPKVQALIKHRLGGAPTLRYWLLDRGLPVGPNDDATYKKVQQTRIAWITALIEELKPIQENTNATATRNRTAVRNTQRNSSPRTRRAVRGGGRLDDPWG